MRSTSKLTLILTSLTAGLVIGVTSITIGAGLRGSDRFSDVPAGSYFDEAVGEMAEIGVIRGRPDGSFDPGAPASRADIAVMLKRFKDYLEGGSTSISSSRRSSNSSQPETEDETQDDSPPPTKANPAGSVRFTIGKFDAKEDAGSIKITLIRTGGAEGVVAVEYDLSDGSAKMGEDYLTKKGKLTFADGETSRLVLLDIIDDEAEEEDETFTITISEPEGGVLIGTPATATITIEDDDGEESDSQNGEQTLKFSALAYEVAEDAGSISITVERIGGDDGEVSVDYATSNGKALAVSDYQATSGTLEFADDETEKSFTITINDDQSTEGNEKLNITLSNPSGAVLNEGDESVELTIRDNEVISSGTGSLRLSDSEYDVQESAGELLVIVERTGGTEGEISVDYDTTNGLAKKGEDYEEAEGTLIFRDGEAKKTIAIVILEDEKNDPNETFSFGLSNPTHGATLEGPETAVVTIRQ